MSEPLTLFETPAGRTLTDRQQAVLDAVTRAGIDGLDADQAGAILHSLKEGRWSHGRDERCLYCARDGDAVLRRLRELGHVRYRRAKGGLPAGWVPAAKVKTISEELPPDTPDDAAGIYNSFPAGF